MRSIISLTPLCAFLLACSLPAGADSLLVGFNAQTPLQIYSSSRTHEQDFGPNGASAGVIQDGLLYIVQPNTTTLDSSTITAFDRNQKAVSSFTLPYLISDAAAGAKGSLWLSGYNGSVYDVTTSGALEGSFSTGFTNATSIGIASNGTNLFTTEGDTSDAIDERDTTGKIIATFHTGYTGLYGLAFDSSSSTFLAGSFDNLYRFQLSTASATPGASLMGSLAIAGNARTANGAIHDGLEVGDLSSLITVPPPTAVPEPRLGLFTGILLLGILGWRAGRRSPRWRAIIPILAIACLPAATAFGEVTVQLAHTTSTVPVGTTISFTASATDSTNASATFVYRFAIAPHGNPTFSVIKDYYKINTFSWTPRNHEGSFDVRVIARSSTGAMNSDTETILVTSRVSGGTPVVSDTQNPLVAFYSAPPCSSPKQVRVRFRGPGETAWQMTPLKQCIGFSLNFYIAGMRANTTYALQQDTFNGPFNTPGPQLHFTTGNLPASLPGSTTIKAAEPPTSISYPFQLIGTGGPGFMYATDLQNNVVWFLSNNVGGAKTLGSGYLVRPVPGGTFFGVPDDPVATAAVCTSSPGVSCGDHQFFREYDLAGTVVRETNWTIVNREIDTIRAQQGKPPVHLNYFHHDGYRLSNGNTIAMVLDEEVKDQGAGPVDVLGDIIIVLDPNFHVIWVWDAFDHLDVKRKSPLNPTCFPGQPGCPAKLYNKDSQGRLYKVANDWTHMNAAVLDAKDGNIIISSRHQSWVLKVDYRNGAGTGNVIWRLGKGGDFHLANGLPASTWFSYQHDPEFESNGALTLFDNSNLRFPSGGNSRGQVWQLDETNLVATPLLNVDLGVQSAAVGAAARLSNGNYWYCAGFILPLPGTTQSSEVTPAGDLVYRSGVDLIVYRTFRLRSMYGE